MQRRSTYTEGRGLVGNYYFEDPFEFAPYDHPRFSDPSFWNRSYVYPFVIEGMGSPTYSWLVVLLIIILLIAILI